MLDVFTVGRKAAKYGYRKFGVPGAVVAGVGGAVGYRAVKKTAKSVLERRAESDAVETEVKPAGTEVDDSASVSVPVDDAPEGENADVDVSIGSDTDADDADDA